MKNIIIICTAVLALSVFYGCKKETASLPIVLTNAPSKITLDSVVVSGTIISDGGDLITECGISLSDKDWDLSYPQGARWQIAHLTSTGQFTVIIKGGNWENDWIPGHRYRYCAYAKNSAGSSGGESYEFTIPLNETEEIEGTWDIDEIEIDISGSAATFSEINWGLWYAAKAGGFVTTGTEFIRNITSTGVSTWSCQNLWAHYTESGGDYSVSDTFWSSSASLTLSNDGNSLTLYSEAYYNGQYYSGSGTFVRKGKGTQPMGFHSNNVVSNETGANIGF